MDNILPGQLTPYQQKYRDALKTVQDEMTEYGKFQDQINNLQSLLQYKNDYANAGNDAQKQQIAHEKAEALRNVVAQNNGDLSVADNMNANQLTGYLQGLENEAKKRFLYRKTPEQLNAQLTQQYLQSGLSKEKAIERAYYDTKEYAADYAATGKMLFGDRGTTNNAVNNSIGVPLMMLLSDTAPEVAQIAAATNALPKDNWTADQRIRQMFTAGDIASGQSAQQYKQNLGLLGAKIAGQRQLNQDKYAADLDRLITGANLNMQAMERQYSLMSEEKRAQVDYFAKGFKNAGYSDGEAWAMAIGLVGGGNKTQQTQEKELTAKEKDIAGEISVAMQTLLKNAIGDEEGSKPLEMDKYEEIQAKRAPHLPYDARQEMEDVKNIANFWAEYNRGGKGKGRKNENTGKYAKEILENERILKLAERYTPGISQILEVYKNKDWRK